MERGSQERDRGGMPNSMNNFNPIISQISQDSPVKLPLAPIISTPPDKRGNTAMISTRRGSSIFSPTQTLDQHHPSIPHQLPSLNRDPDPVPAQTATTPTGGASPNFKNPAPAAQPPEPASAAAAATNSNAAIRYRECLKNHAASMGGHVVDGCGEFMPGGEEGTPESLKCAACDCHRNFHRKEVEGYNNSYHTPFGQTTPTMRPQHQQQQHHHHQKHSHSYSHGPTRPTMVNFGGGGALESSSEDLNMFNSSGGGHAVTQPSYSGSKKRFRTKFNQEQKDRMHDFATKIGWRMQKQNEQDVQQFCAEVGVNRNVFKVWMHNNKQAMKKKQN